MTALRGGPAEAGVRRAVVRADVRLDLDDPPDAPAGRVVADEARAEERPGGLEGRPAPGRPTDRRRLSGG